MNSKLTPVQKARIRKLVDTLRTTNKRQGRGYLRQRGNKTVKFCCLGIACEVAIAEGVEISRNTRYSVSTYSGGAYSLPSEVRNFFGFEHSDPRLLDENGNEDTASGLNDDEKYNFKRIADAFERTYLSE